MSRLTSSRLGMIRFDGADVQPFLQGYLTADTTKLNEQWQLTALCDIKGRVIASGWASLQQEGVWWVLHTDMVAPVLEFLAPYLRFSRTRAEQVEAPVVFELQPALRFDAADGPAEDGDEALLSHLFEHRIVLVDSTTTGGFLPQMIGLVDAGAVSFDKGCYLGQEVVARAQHRGEVKRRLAVAEGANDDPVALKAPQGTLVVTRNTG